MKSPSRRKNAGRNPRSMIWRPRALDRSVLFTQKERKGGDTTSVRSEKIYVHCLLHQKGRGSLMEESMPESLIGISRTAQSCRSISTSQFGRLRSLLDFSITFARSRLRSLLPLKVVISRNANLAKSKRP